MSANQSSHSRPDASYGSTPTGGNSPASTGQPNSTRNSSSPGPFARPPVRRLSQLEPVHIAALNQEYRSQIREAALASNSDVQREHYDKARKIKILLEKYDVMVQEKRKKQQGSNSLPNQSSPHETSLKSEDYSSSPSPSLPKIVSPQPSTPSISQQMAANPSRYQYSNQLGKQSSSDSQSQYSQFRVQLDGSSPTPALSGQGTSTGQTSQYYNKNMQLQSSEPLTAQLQRYKQMEKEAQDQLTELEKSIREKPNMDVDSRAKLRSQEQQLRTKRDQFKSMALTVTQQLQSSLIKQQKSQNQKNQEQQQGFQISQQSSARGMENQKANSYPSKSESSLYNSASRSFSDLDSQQDSNSSFHRNYNSSTHVSRQSSPTASSPPSDNYTNTYSSYSQATYGSNIGLPSSSMASKSHPPPLPTLPSNLPASYNSSSLHSNGISGSFTGGLPSSLNSSIGSKTTPGAYKHNPQSLTKSNTLPGKPVRVPGKVGRPPLTSLNAKRLPIPASSMPQPPAVIPEKVYNKRKISELIKTLMPDDMEGVIENEVEDLIGDLVEEFVGNVTNFSTRLAKHRRADCVESKDVHVHLERNWNLRVPGFPGDEVTIVRKNVPTKNYSNKLDMVNASKTLGGFNRM